MRTIQNQRALWAATLTAPLALEAWALNGTRHNEQRLTFTRNTIDTFQAHTPQGRTTFTITWAAFALWYWRHIIKRAHTNT